MFPMLKKIHLNTPLSEKRQQNPGSWGARHYRFSPAVFRNKREPWKNNSWVQTQGFRGVLQDRSALSTCSNISEFKTCVSALDLSSRYCAMDVEQVIIKGLVGICMSSVWKWSLGDLILCSIPKYSGHVFTFCGSQLAAL